MAPYYRIDLEGFVPLANPMPVDGLLKDRRDSVASELEQVRGGANGERLRPPFQYIDDEHRDLGLAQAYLTNCTPRLYAIIRDWVHGRQSPRASPRYWAIGLGEGGRLWNKCQEEGLVAIGWDEIGDLNGYVDRDEIAKALRDHRGAGDPAPSNDSLACFEFVHKIRAGDYVIAKVGRKKVLGIGVVIGDYEFDPSRPEYRHIRNVDWRRAANVDLPDGVMLPTKTLTDVTDYQDFIDFVVENLIEAPAENSSAPAAEPFPVDRAHHGVFMEKSEFGAILAFLEHKKNVILQGAPGVGKTYVARRLAYALLGEKDAGRVAMVQFHQSYSYEDFIQGYRPRKGSAGFHLQDGLFLDFCNQARNDLKRKYAFIIDEINRGNLSKIFGELMMLIEADKRGSEYAIRLTYANSDDPPFSVPENVHLIGLMNTADRSLALVDYALRRRFIFFTLEPQFESSAFREHLLRLGAPTEIIARIKARMRELNAAISSDDANLGYGFVIGHSFFCAKAAPEDWSEWYSDVIRYEIAPLLREYWFDDCDKAQQWVDQLLAS
jgi:5-methylcytosine-specific restriction protein B